MLDCLGNKYIDANELNQEFEDAKESFIEKIENLMNGNYKDISKLENFEDEISLYYNSLEEFETYNIEFEEFEELAGIKGLDFLEELEDEYNELIEIYDFIGEIDHLIRNQESLILESYFTEYTEEFCEDVGYINSDLPYWIEINWESTAENLRADYSEYNILGYIYLGID